jgi:ABC-type nitrate/sulfonate/bicarbonate transport system permease component
MAVWEVLSGSGLVYRGVLPSWLAIFGALFHLVPSPVFWSNFGVTVFEIALALLIGSLLGIAAGIAIGASRFLALGLDPIVNTIASTPKVIFLPVLYLAFGVGVGSKIAVGALACFFPMVISVTAAMLQINPVLVRVGRSFGLSRRQMVRKIYLPSLVEPIAGGLRIAIGIAIAVCLVAETRFSYAGLGFMVIDAFNRARFADVYALLVVIIALAVSVNALTSRMGRRRA